MNQCNVVWHKHFDCLKFPDCPLDHFDGCDKPGVVKHDGHYYCDEHYDAFLMGKAEDDSLDEVFRKDQ